METRVNHDTILTLRKTVKFLQNNKVRLPKIDNSSQGILYLLLKNSNFKTSLRYSENEVNVDYNDKADITGKLVGKGFELRSLELLESLADAEILKRIPEKDKPLKRSEVSGMVTYLNTWAEQLEERFMRELNKIEEPHKERFFALL